eukprot:UN08855
MFLFTIVKSQNCFLRGAVTQKYLLQRFIILTPM